jgi:hypothetical protein
MVPAQCCSSTPAGDPKTIQSDAAGYLHVTSVMHNLYNKVYQWQPDASLLDVKHASRSVVWLKPDYVVIYDRWACHLFLAL